MFMSWQVNNTTIAAERVIPGSGGIVITPDGIRIDTQKAAQEWQKKQEKEKKDREEKDDDDEDAEPEEARGKDKDNVHVTTVCPPGSKARVNVGKDGTVKDTNVTTVCVEGGGDAEVNVGSVHIDDPKKVKNTVISRKVTGSKVTTITGKGSKSSVDVGSVTIGK